MEIQNLEFNQNWNGKLDCDCFTSIRLGNSKKYAVGYTYRVCIVQHERVLKTYPRLVTCVAKISLKMNAFTDYMCHLDTGTSVEETKAILRDLYRFKQFNVDVATFDYCLFKYIDTPSEIQGSIFG